jgi:hypothetical protein
MVASITERKVFFMRKVHKVVVSLFMMLVMGLSSYTVFAADQLNTEGLDSGVQEEQTNVIVENKESDLATTAVMNSSVEVTNSIANVKQLGAKGNGITDDTAAIQNALNLYDNIFIPEGVYMINVDSSLKPKSNQTITMSENAVLKAIPSSKGYSAVIRISEESNVTVTGGKIIGERNDHIGTTGTWGMGVTILNGASNIAISDMTISDCWGDGVYLGGSPEVSGITIDSVISDNNRRQGMSITNASNVTVSNSMFINTNGFAPSAGIDIEPNANETATGIKVINVQAYNNAGPGIQLLGKNGAVQDVEIADCTINDNVGVGFKLDNISNMTVNNVMLSNNSYGIEIPRDISNVTFSNMNIINNRLRGVSIVASKQTLGIQEIAFEDSIISNNSQNKPGEMDGIKIDSIDSTGVINEIEFNNVKFIDDQVTPTQRYGMTVGSSETISGVTINADCSFSGNKTGSYIGKSVSVK